MCGPDNPADDPLALTGRVWTQPGRQRGQAGRIGPVAGALFSVAPGAKFN
jgi:hypothetical protein